MSKQISKYRPVLSESDITHILALCRRDGSNASMSIIATLAQFEYKILHGAISAAYVESVRPTLIEDCGFAEPPPAGKTIVDDTTVNDEALYAIWLQRPEQLNARSIARVRAWRYEQNKMSMDEEKLFEKEVLGL